MDKILEELWYGNIDPMEAVGSGGPQYKELMELMARNREKIAAKLDENMQEVLETYDENIRENSYWTSSLIEYLNNGIDLISEYKHVVESITVDDCRKAIADICNQGNHALVVMNGVAK